MRANEITALPQISCLHLVHLSELTVDQEMVAHNWRNKYFKNQGFTEMCCSKMEKNTVKECSGLKHTLQHTAAGWLSSLTACTKHLQSAAVE